MAYEVPAASLRLRRARAAHRRGRRCSCTTTSTTRPTWTRPTPRSRAPSCDGKPIEEVLENLDVAARRQAGRRPQQRRRPLQPLAVLGVDEPGRRRRARRRRWPSAIDAAFGSFDDFKAKFKDTGVGQFGSGWAWLVLDGGGLAVVEHAQPGQPDLRRPDAAARRRRLGARLLPQVPEQAPRLPRRVVERRQLGQGRRALRGGAVAAVRRPRRPRARRGRRAARRRWNRRPATGEASSLDRRAGGGRPPPGARPRPRARRGARASSPSRPRSPPASARASAAAVSSRTTFLPAA